MKGVATSSSQTTHRARGARQAGSRAYEQARLADAEGYAAAAAAALRQASDKTEALAGSVRELQPLTPPYTVWRRRITTGLPLADALPDRALAAVYRSKIRVQELSQVVEGSSETPFNDLADRLTSLASARIELSRSLDFERRTPQTD